MRGTLTATARSDQACNYVVEGIHQPPHPSSPVGLPIANSPLHAHGQRRPSIPQIRKETLRPPIPECEGEWVDRQDFSGRKSFGFFACTSSSCGGNRWTSAHAYPEYKQACAKCERGYHPLFMWVNYYSDRSEDVDEEDDRAPHHRQRCEACRRGVCDAL